MSTNVRTQKLMFDLEVIFFFRTQHSKMRQEDLHTRQFQIKTSIQIWCLSQAVGRL